MDKKHLLDIEKSIAKNRILVIGDVMIDAYLFGSVDRISPEAPVPIVNLNKRNNRLGGAANVALNIQSMGATPILCAIVGADENGKKFIRIMESLGLCTEAMIHSPERITTVKYRIIGNNAQLLRVDEEMDSFLSSDEQKQMLAKINYLLDHSLIDAIIFEDYDKGVINPMLIRAVIEKAGKASIPVTVDPKKRNFNHYDRCTLFKPNLKELKEGTKASIDYTSTEEVSTLVAHYIADHDIKMALITMSEKGVLVVWSLDGKYRHALIPAHFRNIVDVSGAGDTVISVATLVYLLGFSPEKMAAVANLAGGLVCEVVGVVPIDKSKLLSEISRLKL